MREPPPTAELLSYAAPGAAPSRAPRPPVVRIVVLGLLLCPVILGIGYGVASLIPWGWDSYCIVIIARPLWPEDAMFYVVAKGTGGRHSTRFTSVYVAYTGQPDPGRLDVDLAAMMVRPAHAPGGAVPLKRSTIDNYISRAGFEPGTDYGKLLSGAIAGELEKLARGELPPDVTDRPSSQDVLNHVRYEMRGIGVGPGYSVWLPWFTPYCIVSWLIAWLLLARWLLRRHRRYLERMSSGTAT